MYYDQIPEHLNQVLIVERICSHLDFKLEISASRYKYSKKLKQSS